MVSDRANNNMDKIVKQTSSNGIAKSKLFIFVPKENISSVVRLSLAQLVQYREI